MSAGTRQVTTILDNGEKEDRIELLMPRALPGAGAATIVRWHVAPGDRVREGDILALVDAKGSTIEIEASADARVDCIFVPAGAAPVPPGIALLVPDVMAATAKAAAAAAGDAHASATTASAETERARSVDGEVSVELSVREALNATLVRALEADPRIVLIGASVVQTKGAMDVTAGLADRFGAERVVATSEGGALAAGLALGAFEGGLVPVLSLDSGRDWLSAFEAIATAAMRARLARREEEPQAFVIRIRETTGHGAGPSAVPSGALLAHIPGLTVAAPSSARAARGLLEAALAAPHPVVLVEDEDLYAREGPVPLAAGFSMRLGKGEIARPGRHATVAAYGAGVGLALEAADVLAREHIEAEVIDLCTLAPLDLPLVIASVHRTGRLVTVEQGWPFAGLGAEIIASVVASELVSLKAPPRRVAAPHEILPYAPSLELGWRPAASHIVEAVRAATGG